MNEQPQSYQTLLSDSVLVDVRMLREACDLDLHGAFDALTEAAQSIGTPGARVGCACFICAHRWTPWRAPDAYVFARAISRPAVLTMRALVCQHCVKRDDLRAALARELEAKFGWTGPALVHHQEGRA